MPCAIMASVICFVLLIKIVKKYLLNKKQGTGSWLIPVPVPPCIHGSNLYLDDQFFYVSLPDHRGMNIVREKYGKLPISQLEKSISVVQV